MKTNCGIYRITNIINGKIYIGSSINIKSRKYKHIQALNTNKHANGYLQRAYNKYGKENFKWEVIEHVERIDRRDELREVLLRREQYYLDFYKSYDSKIGYNLLSVAGSPRGRKHTNKSKRKMSESQKARNDWRPLSEEHKRRISESNKGHIVSEETRGKIGKAHKGMHHSLESKIKISNKLKGRKLSKEHREKIGDNHSRHNMKPVVNMFSGLAFESVRAASIYYSINESHIYSVCRGKRRTAGGYQWMYYNKDSLF